jgi:hypothetical protein
LGLLGALLGGGGGPLPVALHGLDPAATDRDDRRADHDGQDGVPQAGHDPRGDLQLVQGRERPEDQDRDAGPLGQDLAAGDAGEQVGAQVGDRLGDRGGDHDDDDGHQHVGQIGDQALEQVADRVGAEHPEGDLQGDQEDQPEGQLGDDVRGVVLAFGQGLLEPAPFHGPVEADPFQDLVEDGGDDPGQQVADQDDHQGGGQLRHEGDDVGPGAGDTTLEVDGKRHERTPCYSRLAKAVRYPHA